MLADKSLIVSNPRFGMSARLSRCPKPYEWDTGTVEESDSSPSCSAFCLPSAFAPQMA